MSIFQDTAKVGMYTAVLTVALTLFTVILMGGQLREARRQTRVTERPWIRFRYQGEEVGVNPLLRVNPFEPIVLPTEFMNVGLTPALDTEALLVVEVVPIDKEPDFRSDVSRPKEGAPTIIGTNVTKFNSGVIYPSQPAKFKSERFRFKDGLVIPWEAEPEEVNNLRDLNSYVVIWGEIWYRDVFGTQHWTQFCNATAFGELEIKNNFRFPKCANFNNADTNDGSKFSDFVKFW